MYSITGSPASLTVQVITLNENTVVAKATDPDVTFTPVV